jgi:spermidine synthase
MSYHNFLPNFLKNIFSVFIVVALGIILLTSQYWGVLVGLANKTTLTRMPAAC